MVSFISSHLALLTVCYYSLQSIQAVDARVILLQQTSMTRTVNVKKLTKAVLWFLMLCKLVWCMTSSNADC